MKPKDDIHATIDSELDEKGSWGQLIPADKETWTHKITYTTSLSYRFSPHFHPYARRLFQELMNGSVRGLQAVDTRYVSGGNGLLQVQPHTVLCALAAKTNVWLTEVDKLELPAGSRLTLLDGAKGDALGSNVTLPGKLMFEPKRGLKVGAKELPFGTKLKLTQAAPAAMSLGQPVKIPSGTELVLMSAKPRPELYAALFNGSAYDPNPLAVELPYPVKDLDFSSWGAYAVYNWELFYHAPLTIAMHLSKNQRYEEALRWFHYVFDPTDDSEGPTPERFWKVKPFQFTDAKLIEEIMVNLSSGNDPALQKETTTSIAAWKNSPFRPHAVARYRQTAYMFKTVMAYVDNLMDWGDSLFRQDTGESINEATQLYVLAANILGQRPQAVPKKGSVRPATYSTLRDDLDAFGNALVKLESEIPFAVAPAPGSPGDSAPFAVLASLGHALYFGIPRNDKLLTYWDNVADRLFKIRNSLNLQGIFRQLPLFEPPIDPGMLAKAAAAGLDVGAVISGLNQPLPLVRFALLVQKAAEICQEAKSLGNALLSAIEKEDNEALAILRAKHERVMNALVETVRYTQLQEAIKNREATEKGLALAIQRYVYNERQLGRKDNEIKIPELEKLDGAELERMKHKAAEPEMAQRDVPVDIVTGGPVAAGGFKISSYETAELAFITGAQIAQDVAVALELSGAIVNLIPDIEGKAQPMGVGAGVKFGGKNVGQMLSAMAGASKGLAGTLSFGASMSGRLGGFARREQEWAYQSNLAAGEITQAFKHLRAAQLREAVAERELKNHRQQMKHSEEIEKFLQDDKKGKKAGVALYAWMKREVKGLYAQSFQFAYDVAKKAERALQHELGDPDASFIQFGYLAGKEGLLAGEKLHMDVKRMELAYHELNRREYELTKHVSLLQLDPHALLALRATGRCTVALPEELFDMDGPGHYFRRIKSVGVSIPCVTGPYVGVNCTLTLLKSAVRKNALLRDGAYARENAEDDRFSDHFGSLQSIVTSQGQNDSGLFETNLKDERYLPFEGSGAVSEWQLELPSEVRQFDYETISDVIIHVRYTAREGGNLLKNAAVANLATQIKEANAAGSVRLFSLRHEFPVEWSRFKSTAASTQGLFKLEFELRAEHYPYWSIGRLDALRRFELFAKTTKNTVEVHEKADKSGGKFDLMEDPEREGLREGKLEDMDIPTPTGKVTLYLDDKTMEDLWIAAAWRSTP